MPLNSSTIAVVGATGAVGRECLGILRERGVPAGRIVALASGASDGRSIPYGDVSLKVREVNATRFSGVGLALFCASAEAARGLVPAALASGANVIDNSSAFRSDPAVPLVIPEVNGELLRANPRPRLIANPNCSTILLLVALNPLRKRFGIDRIVVSTYQAVSGAGLEAMSELREQAVTVLQGGAPSPRVFAEPCAFNVFSHDSALDAATGLNAEERKLIDESRKIWDQPSLGVSPTCIRVSVFRAHTESVTLSLRTAASESDIRESLASADGVEIVDDRRGNRFPTPLKASGKDAVLVGRIRADPASPVDEHGRTTGWSLLLCGDQIRKGAALNAVQIAERVGLV